MLNPLVYHHVHFDGVVSLEHTFISQDTKLFPGSGRVFSSAQLVVIEPSLFHSEFCLAGLSAAVHFDLNKLGEVAQLTNSICLTKLGACSTVKMTMAGIFLKYQVSEISVEMQMLSLSSSNF